MVQILSWLRLPESSPQDPEMPVNRIARPLFSCVTVQSLFKGIWKTRAYLSLVNHGVPAGHLNGAEQGNS